MLEVATFSAYTKLCTYLAFSKVAAGVFPMAPNPTPTASPSETQGKIQGVAHWNWISSVSYTEHTSDAKMDIKYRQKDHLC